MATQAFIKITCNGYYGVEEFYAVRMHLEADSVVFYAGGHGYRFKNEDIISIEPYCC